MRVPLSHEAAKELAIMVFESKRVCPICGKIFMPTNIKDRFCSRKCYNADWWNKAGVKNGPSDKEQ